MGARREAREAALEMLYLNDVGRLSLEEAEAAVWKGKTLPEKTQDFARRLAFGTHTHQSRVDHLLAHQAKNWEIHRMAAVDRNLLRLATYELLEELETPVSVIIDEAIEIAKKYSTDESGKFVNGILDQIKNERTDSPSPRRALRQAQGAERSRSRKR